MIPELEAVLSKCFQAHSQGFLFIYLLLSHNNLLLPFKALGLNSDLDGPGHINCFPTETSSDT